MGREKGMKKEFSFKSYLSTPSRDWSVHTDRLARAILTNRGPLCGMCGHSYSHMEEAWHCVTKDVALLQSFPVNRVNSHDSCSIPCLLCGKIFVNAQDAALCLSHDLQSASLPPELMEHLSAMALSELKGVKISKREDMVSRHSLLQEKKKSEK
jgi:hypothetical protein